MEAVSRIKQIIGEYRIGSDNIGSGSNTVVRVATHTRTSQLSAVKIIDIAQSQVRVRAHREAEILRELGKHKHIIQLHTHQEDDRFLYLFMEYAPGGDLFSLVHKQGSLDENKARTFFRQILEALTHCHSHSVIHHDVKLENMVLGKDNIVRLSDFGLSVRKLGVETVTTFAGSPLYMAPEVMSRQPHDERIDIWSLGVCLYIMVSGTFPFVANTYEELEERVLFHNISYVHCASENFNDLVRGLLRKDPEARLTLQDVRKHPWMVEDVRPSFWG
eukprot:TRINITY_DN4465_c0_g1_i1.p1 TRINITY_DN4465_c0_g1~~TRINITY_DN4465_c0_g1_i1.p1  ORF type:complete len:275 (-),score=2.61 TRINITY_DN4465_c0_g1_i1:53-877(-)